MRTLLYLASGQYHPLYDNLPFDKIILVDRSVKDFYKNYQNLRSITDLPIIECLSMDALYAIDYLKERNIKIDCLVSVNEGLYNGGGTYPIFSDMLLGYLSPILKDDLLVITDLSYYLKMHDRVAKMDWGFDKKKLKTSEPGYINPNIFSRQNRNSSSVEGDVYRLKRVNKETILKVGPFAKVKIIHDSIWRDEKELDLLGINIDCGHKITQKETVSDFFNKKTNVFNIKGKSFKGIVAHCLKNNIKSVGLMPWLDGKYESVINYLKSLDKELPFEIRFYHLRKGDFKELYMLVEK
jgi:hypothetical protein